MPVSPANTFTEVPLVVLLPVETEFNITVLLVKPVVAGIETASPEFAPAQTLRSVSVAPRRVFVYVHTVAAALLVIVSVRPTVPLASGEPPVHCSVTL